MSLRTVQGQGPRPRTTKLVDSIAMRRVWQQFSRLTLLYIVLPCVATILSRPAWRKLVLLIARYVSNLINEHYYYYYYYYSLCHFVLKLFTAVFSAIHIWSLCLLDFYAVDFYYSSVFFVPFLLTF